jgi:ABC-2 type transport system permease protein
MNHFEIIKAYWKESVAYRFEFLVSVLIVPVRFFILVMIWSAVYYNSGSDSIQGYSLSSMVTYFLISSLVFTFVHDTVAEELENEIKKGNFLVFLLKPISYIKLGFLKKIANRSFAVVVEIVPIVILFIIFFRKYFIMGELGFFAISIIFAFVISYLIYLLIGMIAFWLINIRSLAWLISFGIQLSAGLFVPIDLFPSVIRGIFNVLPFQYIAFVPTSIYLGKYGWDLSSGFVSSVYFPLLIQISWIVGLFALTLFVWNKAKKRFSGVGA